MIKQYDIYNPYNQQEVTAFYVDIISESLRACGYEIKVIDKMPISGKGKGILVVSIVDVKMAKKKGYEDIILWVQGILPEESYVRHQSILRKIILEYVEKRALNCADKVILVSKEMEKHYQSKYQIKMKSVFHMPCFNSTLDEKVFNNTNKYKKETFVYVGGMQKWQCFEYMAQIYAAIEKEQKDSFIYIFTQGKEIAEEILRKYDIKNYEIAFVTPQELDRKLENIKFGFVLREDIAVNRVATPTKLSNYLSCGIIPIFTSCLTDFYEVMQGNKYKICIDNICDVEKNATEILQWSKNNLVDLDEITIEYKHIFQTYYSREKYVEELKQFLKG